MALERWFAVAMSGGLTNCDVPALNRSLRRSIHSPRDYARPIDLASALILYEPHT